LSDKPPTAEERPLMPEDAVDRLWKKYQGGIRAKHGLWEDVITEIRAAVEAERERCAAHLESLCDCGGGFLCGWCKGAAAIRAMGEE